MNNYLINKHSIHFVELGITNKCNLRCPLCIQVKNKIYEQPTQYLSAQELINFLKELPNLERVNFEGNYSEPLLYPEIFELIKYLKIRKLKIIISTNASFKGESFWAELGSLLDERDIVRFAVDGSSQELYEKYRVGGDLSLVLSNHSHLKRNSKSRTVLQNIQFKFNVGDLENIRTLFKREGFDYLNFTKCYMSDGFHGDISPVLAVDNHYRLFNKMLSSESDHKLICDSQIRGEVYINHFGDIYLCGSHDLGDGKRSPVGVKSSHKEIFSYLNDTYLHRSESKICKSDCNLLCYSVGRRFPDILIDQNDHVREIKYFAKDIDEDHGAVDEVFTKLMKG